MCFVSGAVVANLNRKKGIIDDVQPREGGFTVVKTFVPLAKMFGYSTELRSCTEGKGEFAMEYARHEAVSGEDQRRIEAEYEKVRERWRGRCAVHDDVCVMSFIPCW